MKQEIQTCSISVGDEEIFAILKAGKKGGKTPLVVLCHGWSGNHLGTWNAFFPYVAAQFAAKGIASLRFDFRGSGNSDGVFEDQTVKSMLQDLKAVMRYTQSIEGVDPNKIVLAGHSQGAYVAFQYAAKYPGIRAVISLMGRVSDLQDFISASWMNEAKRQGFLIGEDGYRIEYDKYIKDSFNYSSKDALGKIQIPVGLLYGERDNVVPPSEGILAQTWLKEPTKMEILPELGHDFTGARGIQEKIAAMTIRWVRKWTA